VNDLNLHIANRLQKLLKIKKITQEELSIGINKSKTSINNWIAGRNKIDAVSLHLISTFLKVPVSYFFDESEIPLKSAVLDGNYPKTCIECDKLKNELQRKDQMIEDMKFTIDSLKLSIEVEQRILELVKERFGDKT